MAFQSEVFIPQGAGVPGDRYDNSPWRAQPYTLKSVDANYNIVGATAYTKTGEGQAQAGSAGAFGYAGILVNSKVYTTSGTLAGGTLDATLVLPNEGIAEITDMGSYFVTLPAAANIGDLVVYDNTTGALETIAPLAALPAGKSFAFAKVDRFTVGPAGIGPQILGVITLTPTLAIPAP